MLVFSRYEKNRYQSVCLLVINLKNYDPHCSMQLVLRSSIGPYMMWVQWTVDITLFRLNV